MAQEDYKGCGVNGVRGMMSLNARPHPRLLSIILDFENFAKCCGVFAELRKVYILQLVITMHGGGVNLLRPLAGRM